MDCIGCFDKANVGVDVLEKIGVENIDYAMDWHDGGNVMEHYWINYSVDGDNRIMVDDFINYLIVQLNLH